MIHFVKELSEVLEHSTQREEYTPTKPDDSIHKKGGVVRQIVFTVEPPELLNQFEERWQMEIRNRDRLVALLGWYCCG